MAVYSHSKLETFRNCPRKFYYRYVKRVKLDSEPEHIATFLGSRVHEALEFLYQRTQLGIVPTEGEVLENFRSAWKLAWSKDVILPDKKVTASQFRAIGEKCVSDYHARNAPFDQSQVIGLEKQILFPLDSKKKHQIRGFIDRLAKKPDGTWQIHDYKTNSRLPTQANQDVNSQLAFYELGIRQMWPGIERVELVWHFLRFDQQIVSTRKPQQLQELKAQTLETIAEIESREPTEETFPTRESGLCVYCEYQALCPVRKHLFETQQLLANKFLKEPGVKLVNRWASLKAHQDKLAAQQSALQEEIDQIKEALCTLAEPDQLERIVGTEKEVAVVREHRTLFPRKGQEPEAAAKLEALLRRSRWWKQVSSLDRNTLTSLWNDRASLDPELKKVIKAFVFYEDATHLRLRKRQE